MTNYCTFDFIAVFSSGKRTASRQARNYTENCNTFLASDPGEAEHNNLTALTAEEEEEVRIIFLPLWGEEQQ